MSRSIYQALILASLIIILLMTGWDGRLQPTLHNASAAGPTIDDPPDIPDDLDFSIFLPIISNISSAGPAPRYPRMNLPYFEGDISFPQSAISWFGVVRGANNYTDIRAGYTQSELVIQLSIIDRYAWYDTSPTSTTLTDWDAASIFIDTTGGYGENLSEDAFQFIGQLNWWEARTNYQAAWQGSTAGWASSETVFTTTTTMRGVLWNDNSEYDRGWKITYRIPFSSLGLAGPPAHGTVWGLAVVVYDRDDAAGSPITPKRWPAEADDDRPITWGQIHFGLPAFSPPSSSSQTAYTIRQGLNGTIVPDAAVGGDSNCGDGLSYWNTWGDTNYAHQTYSNIQNQADVADWPCFSKYYLTFPLDSLPANKLVISAALTLHQFGGSLPSEAVPSLIQVLIIGDDWNESALTWNNAPMGLENVSQTWVQPLITFPGWPGAPYQWDLSRAISQFYTSNQPLRLVLYSADGAYHSGKYFLTSDEADWNQIARPTLEVILGDP